MPVIRPHFHASITKGEKIIQAEIDPPPDPLKAHATLATLNRPVRFAIEHVVRKS